MDRSATFELTPTSLDGSRTMPPADADEDTAVNRSLHSRTVRKLDWLLLPFLALLFLFNALDKSNIGNAESAHFTKDIGLEKSDLNTSVALFFAFFVTLQPVGAAVGRKYGMVAVVPTAMLLWGLCTALHAFVTQRWQLYTLRVLIGCFEAGFYPVTVTYLSQFYTRFEFGRRLSMFYGQAALGGALGGIISYFVFSKFPGNEGATHVKAAWRPWQILFLLEGILTMITAAVGYFWLPHSVESAWFLTPEERQYACTRVLKDRDMQNGTTRVQREEGEDDGHQDEESRGLLTPAKGPNYLRERATLDDRGLTPRDIFTSIFNVKVWHILACNILSSIPIYAFSIFLPLVLAPLSKEDNPALVNLLTAPPHLCGALALFAGAHFSDVYEVRIPFILTGLMIMIIGLMTVVGLPPSWPIIRYIWLNVLLSGTYVASPLTVAWISGNTPSPGKRALMLGINGWGNFAGILAAMLYKPKYAATDYHTPFWWTLLGIVIALIGYSVFWRNLIRENRRRKAIRSRWSPEAIELEKTEGTGPLAQDRQWVKNLCNAIGKTGRMAWLAEWLEEAAQGGREGDEKITFVYGY